MASPYFTTLTSFCEEMKATFPELAAAIDRADMTPPAHFWRTWSGGLDILLAKDGKRLFEERKGFLIGAVRLTTQDWIEISANTQTAIWRYLRTLSLESAMEISMEGIETDKMQLLMDIMAAESSTGSMFEESMKHLSPLMDKLKGLLGGDGFKGLEGFTMPEIPERLRNGRIAKLAEEMAKQFKPEEFGIDPALLSGDNVEEILKRLADLYQRDPTLLVAGAKRVAERIKRQITGGSLKREELIEEAQEFVALFKDHPMLKEVMSKMGSAGDLAAMFGSGGSSEPSDRRRAVQERLRAKLAARKNK